MSNFSGWPCLSRPQPRSRPLPQCPRPASPIASLPHWCSLRRAAPHLPSPHPLTTNTKRNNTLRIKIFNSHLTIICPYSSKKCTKCIFMELNAQLEKSRTNLREAEGAWAMCLLWGGLPKNIYRKGRMYFEHLGFAKGLCYDWPECKVANV